MFCITDFFTNTKILKSFFKKICIIIFWMVIWEVAAFITDNNILLVGPLETLSALKLIIFEQDFWISIFNTMLRTTGGFLTAGFAAAFLSVIAYRIKLIEEILSPVISLIKSIPVASFVIIVLIWLRGSNMLSFVISFLVVLPTVYINLLNGLKNTDKKLLELSEVYRISFIKKLRYIYMPAVKPFLISSFETTLGMSWKSGIAAELIGQPEHTIGYYLYQSRIFLDTSALFAWTAIIIVLSYILEKFCIFILNRYYSN